MSYLLKYSQEQVKLNLPYHGSLYFEMKFGKSSILYFQEKHISA